MISKNGNIYLLRKKIISDVGRPFSKYVTRALKTHKRPLEYTPELLCEDKVEDRVNIVNTDARQLYKE